MDRVRVGGREEDGGAGEAREEELRLMLYEEMEEWVNEEQKKSDEELERAARYEEELRRIQDEKEARKQANFDATATMVDELQNILRSGQDPFEEFARSRMIAEEKARLVQNAKREAEAQTEKARQVFEQSQSRKQTDQPDA